MSESIKTIMVVLVFNLIIGIMLTAGDFKTWEQDTFDYAITEGGELTNKLDEGFFEENQNDQLLSDAEWGNSYGMGKVFVDIITNGITPLPRLPARNVIEQIFSIIIVMFRTWLWILLTMQVYRLIKNKS